MPYLPGRRRRRLSAKLVNTVLLWGIVAVMVGLRALGVRVGWGWLGLFALVWAAFGLWAAMAKARARRFADEAKLGLHQLTTGKPVRAEAEFARLRQQFRWPGSLPRIAELYGAQALQMQGRFTEAVERLAALEASGGIATLDARIAILLSYCNALAGELDPAAVWFAEAKRRAGKSQVDIIPELVIGLRDGRAAEVRDRLDRDWRALEALHKGELLRRMRLLRAFAIAQTVGPRDAGAVEPVLAGLRPATYDEFAYLATQWPELDQFLRAHLA